jgi:murein DD-endopeptidase MepM/ murein hydrolase activator NlpD
MTAWNSNFFGRVALGSLLIPLLAGCVYDNYLPRMRSSQAIVVPKHTPVVETVSVPANYSPDYRALSYHFITVQGGDTLSRVAARSNVPVQSVIVMNGMRKPYLIYPGQQLKIPAFRSHKVRPGETLYAISRVYDVDIPEVAMFNSLDAPYTLMPGTTLQIPEKSGGEIRVASASMTEWPEPKAAPASGSQMAVKTVVINSLPEVVAVPKSETVASSAPAPAPAVDRSYQLAKLDVPPVPKHRFSIKEPPKRSGEAFVWPVEGKIISGYGKKATGFHNDGVNIAVKEGTPIRAAENGVVSYVGNEMRSFGNLLLISHADGYVTAYGHTERAVVAKGDAVRKGEIIAYAGSSGNVAESQLHFEIRKKGRAVDPVAMLE